MRFPLALVLTVMLALVVVPAAGAIRFADAPCLEAGPGGIRICPAGVAGRSYMIKLEGAGGCGPGLPYQFTLLNAALPPGLSLARNGVLSGTPTRAGNWSFWLELSDEDPPSALWCVPEKSEREFSLRVDAPSAAVGTRYAVRVGAAGDGPQTWSLGSGRLPPGLALNAANGTITGTPLLPGAFPFKLSATDNKGRTVPVELTIVVAPKLVIASTRLPANRAGRPYHVRVRTSGGVGPVTLKVLWGRFPIGVRLNAETGALTGKPLKAGIYRITIEARDALGATAMRTFALTVRRHRA